MKLKEYTWVNVKEDLSKCSFLFLNKYHQNMKEDQKVKRLSFGNIATNTHEHTEDL